MSEEVDLSATWKFQTKAFWVAFLDRLLPPVCASCKKAGARFCEACQAKIQWIQEPICQKCGRLVNANQSICPVCQTRPLPLETIRAATLFAEPVSTVIHKLKYEKQFGLAEPLADLMIAAWPRWQTTADCLVPIPLHPERQKERGYNQSALLAEALSRQIKRPCLPDCLYRTRQTPAQVGLNGAERLANVQNAFAAQSAEVKHKKILLIDDVCTTGATLAAAAQALLDAGAASVWGYCVARAM